MKKKKKLKLQKTQIRILALNNSIDFWLKLYKTIETKATKYLGLFFQLSSKKHYIKF